MADGFRIALARLNPTLGDIAGNVARVRRAHAEAAAGGAALLICPEQVIVGYPAEDLILHAGFAEAASAAVTELASATRDGPAMIVGAPWPHPDGGRPHNVVALLADGVIKAICRKHELPNYAVFDEPRVFTPGAGAAPVMFRGCALGLMVCEDMWFPATAARLAADGADLLIVPHGSPYRMTAAAERRAAARARAAETGLPVLFLNQLGGQDELVFDGDAFCVAPDGTVQQAASFAAGLVFVEAAPRGHGAGWTLQLVGGTSETLDKDLSVYCALVLATQDYVRKSGFARVVLGLSGGIDSALVAAIAVDALGAENVRAVMLPSRYTATESEDDAAACADALGITLDTVAIAGCVEATETALAGILGPRGIDLTHENLQSRLRGVLLMAVSNHSGALLLTTGNKSEMAVGYATLYGDMNGAFNPLKDVYKTQVYRLAALRNGMLPPGALGPAGAVIPEAILKRAPSAELRPNQRDDDSLPPYDVLDAMLAGLVDADLPAATLVAQGFDRDLVARIAGLVYRAEFKRRQSPPGPKVTARNFGKDRRYPIVNRWRDPI